MGIRSNFETGVESVISRHIEDVSDETLDAISREISSHLFDMAFGFGESCGWEKASERIEELENRNQLARKVALRAVEFMAGEGSDEVFSRFSTAVEEFKKGFVDHGDVD